MNKIYIYKKKSILMNKLPVAITLSPGARMPPGGRM